MSSPAVNRQPRAATAIAMTPVEALAVPTSRFISYVETHGSAATVPLLAVAAGVRCSSFRQREFATNDTLGRLCASTVGERPWSASAVRPLGRTRGMSQTLKLRRLRSPAQRSWAVCVRFVAGRFMAGRYTRHPGRGAHGHCHQHQSTHARAVVVGTKVGNAAIDSLLT